VPDFVDRVTVTLKAGNGGNGCASIRREKYKPLAGPNGGNGGNGGSIFFQASSQSTTLLDYHFSAKKSAPSGEMGQGADKDGKRGDDLYLPVPLGTVLKDMRGNIIEDLKIDGQEFLVCRGGEGGLGNAKLASRQRKAPGFALNGIPGEEAKVHLELKLLADVALVGFPSAGKSSIIAAVSAARPKIADYPFTTLVPNLGVVSSYGHRYTIADVPGLIPGAASGKGLGLEFLRHIERTKVIVHVIDMNIYEPGRDPISDYQAIVHELGEYDKLHNSDYTPILERPEIILLNKTDDHAAYELAELTAEEFRSQGKTTLLVSAKSHHGLKEFTQELAKMLLEVEAAENLRADQNADDVENARTVINLTPLRTRADEGTRQDFTVTAHQKGAGLASDQPWYEVFGEKPRRWVLQTDFSNDEAVGYLADRLAKLGIEDELAKLGAVEGDEVRISMINTRADYLSNEQEWYIFEYEPNLQAGAEVLYSNRRGEDTRLDYEDRVRRATRREKREELEQKRTDWANAQREFDRSHQAGLEDE
jgi:GTP-binding protein